MPVSHGWAFVQSSGGSSIDQDLRQLRSNKYARKSGRMASQESPNVAITS
jgi:hypothetical protein